MTLRYLDFDYSEDGEGCGTWDAMASVGAAQLQALHDEIAAVLDWAHAQFGDAQGPIEDGGLWDYDLQAVEEVSTVQTLRFDQGTRRLVAESGTAAAPRHTVTLSLSGTEAFCAAFREHFGLA
ncbi:hypothetical protein M4R22_20985 [Acidovorax sp. GBBC 3334]|uniref:hypothetical protein n=1 Tax=unclassified Acidovorax TaxID=2684926 RepID=UPI0023023E7E|nr:MULTISPECIES: hypothetical protein [unclassified Acidovorax]MDA8457241.1 hypothetical protein [Acidovorax sp. GBBC 3334]MDA8521651.1 hypothetical protein [Acidovorax sp. NCPPB 4044]